MTFLFPSLVPLNQSINKRLLLFFRSGGKDGGSYEPHRYPPKFSFSSVAFVFSFNTCMGRFASFPLIHPSIRPCVGLPTLGVWLHAGSALTNCSRSFVFTSVHTVSLRLYLLCNASLQLPQRLRRPLLHIFTPLPCATFTPASPVKSELILFSSSCT